MRKAISPLLIFVFFTFLSCEVKSFIPQTSTLPSVQRPPRMMDATARMTPEGQLEILGPQGWKVPAGAGLPQRVVYPEMKPSPRPLEGYALGKDTLGVFTPFEVLVSRDLGASFTKVVDRSEFGSAGYITALALHSVNQKILAVGTSFHGIFISLDNGKTWKDFNGAFKHLSPGPGWQEQVNSLAFSLTSPDKLYASIGVRGDLYTIDTLTGKATIEKGPEKGTLTVYDRLFPYLDKNQEMVELRSRDNYWLLDTVKGDWGSLGPREPLRTFDQAKTERMAKAKDKFALYLTSYSAANTKTLDGHLANMEKKGLNALVIDLKDDTGDLAYDSKIDLAIKAGAVKKRLDVPALVKKIHGKGYYLIARVVVFKDMRLFKYASGKYALWDQTTKRPWGFFHKYVDDQTGKEGWVQKEFWVDQYSPEVWEYNAAIAKELQDLGVDEVQFDYIRFPSDGPTGNITYRFRQEQQNRMDALTSFLRVARERVSIPISADIYGFNGWFVMDYLGQNMSIMADYLDAISPMLYPSHYDVKFLPAYTYVDRAKVIYQESGDRGWLATRGTVHIRSWIQAFLLGAETKFADPTWMTYFDNQLIGNQNSKANGFLLWNASNNYYMMTKPLTKYTGLPKAATTEKK